LRGAGTAQPSYMRIKYMFVVQRYVYRAKVRLMPADAGGILHREMWSGRNWRGNAEVPCRLAAKRALSDRGAPLWCRTGFGLPWPPPTVRASICGAVRVSRGRSTGEADIERLLAARRRLANAPCRAHSIAA
jgi:hypothetical protein